MPPRPCFRSDNATAWRAVLGAGHLGRPSAFAQTRAVKTVVLHPRYRRAVMDYDIAVVELSRAVAETSYVRPACLPRPEQALEPDTYCSVTGWGHTGDRSKPGGQAPRCLPAGRPFPLRFSQCGRERRPKPLCPTWPSGQRTEVSRALAPARLRQPQSLSLGRGARLRGCRARRERSVSPGPPPRGPRSAGGCRAPAWRFQPCYGLALSAFVTQPVRPSTKKTDLLFAYLNGLK